jgi:malate synthase
MPSLQDLAENIALLAERDRLQTELDAWHTKHPGPIQNMKAYRAFLEKLATWCPCLPK